MQPAGLSPRARGKRQHAPHQSSGAGPIPAGAGETIANCHRRDFGGAYPRGRGGNVASPGRCSPARGLSPRARGKRSVADTQAPRAGPIPAGAGETPRATSSPRLVRAYPRGRGGTRGGLDMAKRYGGLSPRARGKPAEPGSRLQLLGPIPAGAGETRRLRACRRRCTAYPRGRGGNYPSPILITALVGLSPRARGKLVLPMLRAMCRGPIPAGAGETRMFRSTSSVIWAYPRGRGGNPHT